MLNSIRQSVNEIALIESNKLKSLLIHDDGMPEFSKHSEESDEQLLNEIHSVQEHSAEDSD